MNADGTNQRPLVERVGEHRAPSWSPDSSRLAYSDHDGIHVVDVSTGTNTAIGPGRSPAWSPAGDEIAFVVAGPSGGSLAVAAPDYSGARILTDSAVGGVIAWSPDASRIAFFSCGPPPCTPHVSIVGADGTGEAVVARAASAASWSPDGRAFVVQKGDGDLHVVDLSSGGVTNVTPGSSTGFDPHWGPQGRIAYTGRDDAGEHGVWLVNPDGTDGTFVHRGFGARWAPDGSRIVFVAGNALRVHAPGTEGTPVLTPEGEHELMPAWSPDGRSIAYVSEDRRPPPPEHERSVGASAARDRVRAKVDVHDDFRLCSRGVPVRLQRRTEGEWVPDGRGRTDRRGRVKWRAGDRRKGIYRVLAPETWTGFPGDSDRCLKAASPRFRLGG